MKEESQIKILTSLNDVFIGEIKGLGAECFTGGSFRFGYHNNKSDIDIMVKDPGPAIRRTIITNFGLTNKRDADILQGNSYNHPDIESVYTYKHLVHIVFVHTHAYDQLAQDHIHLDLFYGKYPILLKLIPFLRKVGMSGSNIFRLMRDFSMSKLA